MSVSFSREFLESLSWNGYALETWKMSAFLSLTFNTQKVVLSTVQGNIQQSLMAFQPGVPVNTLAISRASGRVLWAAEPQKGQREVLMTGSHRFVLQD